MNRLEKFIDKAVAVHGDFYDYSAVEYTSSSDKVCIICPEHGEFWQSPADHVRGRGCPVCANAKKGSRTMTTEEFVRKAIEKHGDCYKYGKTVYKGPSVKVTITCSEHGDFQQLPYSHLNGSGCPKCKGFGKTTEDIVNDFKKTHGDLYDYSKVEYNGSKVPVVIICRKHGEFTQTPQKHIKGQGCPDCARERKRKSDCIYKKK